MKQLILFLVLWAMTGIAGTEMMAKTQSKDYDPIEWENKEKPLVRSIFPISGYVEDGMVSIYLYESPAKATVHITDESGAIIYESDYADPSNIVIDLAECDNGAYQVTVEYGEKMFVGAFEITN